MIVVSGQCFRQSCHFGKIWLNGKLRCLLLWNGTVVVDSGRKHLDAGYLNGRLYVCQVRKGQRAAVDSDPSQHSGKKDRGHPDVLGGMGIPGNFAAAMRTAHLKQNMGAVGSPT